MVVKEGDEKISEAQAITNYLLEETDVPQDAIILEDQSRTTYENLLFLRNLVKLVAKPQFLFVTNDYHVFSTSTYARKVKYEGRWPRMWDGRLLYTICFYSGVRGPLCQDEMALP